jgi:hypothetical protein
MLQHSEREISAEVFNYYSGFFAFLLHDLSSAKVHLSMCIAALEDLDNRQLLSQAFYRLGLVFLKLKSENEARRCFNAVLKIFPDHPFAVARVRKLDGLSMFEKDCE